MHANEIFGGAGAGIFMGPLQIFIWCLVPKNAFGTNLFQVAF